MRGRKPKPTALKILEGHQKSRTNFAEPRIPEAELTPPRWLTLEALEHWIELGPVLRSAGLLSQGDRPAFAMLCEEYARIRRSRKAANADKARERYRRWLTEFGLTPSSRSRIKSTAEPPKDELQVFLEKKA
jgi:phage terminase small subunit